MQNQALYRVASRARDTWDPAFLFVIPPFYYYLLNLAYIALYLGSSKRCRTQRTTYRTRTMSRKTRIKISLGRNDYQTKKSKRLRK